MVRRGGHDPSAPTRHVPHDGAASRDGRAGEVDAAILLPPVTVAQIRAAANARGAHAAETTFFAPEAAHRPRVRALADQL